MKNVLFAILLSVAILPGCGEDKKITPPEGNATQVATPSSPSEATDTPADNTADQPAPSPKPAGEVMAMVNGKAVMMDKLHNILVSTYGLDLARQLIATELIDQAARSDNITVTKADITAEEDDSLAQMLSQVPTKEERRALLGTFLVRVKISKPQWDLTMRRNVILGKLAETKVKVTEDDIKQAFHQRYGQKVVVRHIQLPNIPAAQLALKDLASGSDFATLAKKKSINRNTAANGGLLPPISSNDETVDAHLRSAAMALKKPGDLSPIVMIGKGVHILKLEEIIDSQNVDYDLVKDELAAAVKKHFINNLKLRIGNDLLQQAFASGNIEFVDPILHKLNQIENNAKGPRQ